MPDEPSQAEQLAAERLQYYIKQMSGARLAVATEGEAPAGTKVYVGRTRASADITKRLKNYNAPEEASVVSVNDRAVHIVGIDDPGTVHATYFLLEDLGCRWYFPAQWGTVIPKLQNIVLRTQEIYRAPDFKIRKGLPGYNLLLDEDPEWGGNEWGRGNHLGGWNWWGAGHSYNYLVAPDNFAEHPEWFAYYDGKRHPTQLCTTNPEVRQKALETIRTVLSKPNAPRLLCISPNDGQGFCECPNCMKLIPTNPDGTKRTGDSIDRIVEFANFIADAIKDNYPDHYVTYYCDYHSVGTPTLVTPAENTVFWVVQWSQDQFHGVSPETRMGQSLERWGKFGNPIFVYTYYGSYLSFTFWPQVHAIRNDIPYYYDKGAIGLYSETHQHWGTQHLNFIVFPRLLWDVHTDVDAWIDDFCEKFYGPAAEPMHSYYDLLEKTAQDGPPQYHYHSGIVAIFTPSVMTQLRQIIEEAKSRVAGADEVYQRRMQFVADGFRMADLYISANHLKAEYAKTKDETIRQRMIDMYKEVLAIVTHDKRLTDNRISEPALKRELAALQEGTTFGVGPFSYSDGYNQGGKSVMDAVRKSALLDGTWGLCMSAGAKGELVYEFKAKEGVFDTVQITTLALGVRGSISIEVGETADGPWEVVAESQSPDSATSVRVATPVDLTPFVQGKKNFFLRMVLSNNLGGYVLAIDSFGIQGEVVAE